MKKTVLIIILITLIVAVPFGRIIQAKEDEEKEKEETRSYEITLSNEEGDDKATMSIEHEGIVPCGRCLSSGDTYSERLDEIHGCEGGDTTYVPCDMCHLFITFDNIVDFILIDIVPILALFVIVLAGVMYITAAQNPDRTKKAKKAFIWAIAGVFIAYLAWAMTTFFVSQFMEWDIKWGGGDEGMGVQQMCDLKLPEEHPLDEEGGEVEGEEEEQEEEEEKQEEEEEEQEAKELMWIRADDLDLNNQLVDEQANDLRDNAETKTTQYPEGYEWFGFSRDTTIPWSGEDLNNYLDSGEVYDGAPTEIEDNID